MAADMAVVAVEEAGTAAVAAGMPVGVIGMALAGMAAVVICLSAVVIGTALAGTVHVGAGIGEGLGRGDAESLGGGKYPPYLLPRAWRPRSGARHQQRLLRPHQAQRDYGLRLIL